jgi:hypothetical protein
LKRLTAGMVAAILIAFGTLAAAGEISRAVFERLPHLEDEFAYLYQAKIFAAGRAWAVRDDPVKVFWQPFVIQPETQSDGVYKKFGKYTPGWPLLLSVGVALGQPWIVNGFLAMLTVALVYRMAREIFSESVGVVSALLLAISPMALLLNATLMSHVSAMFMGVLFVYGYWRIIRNGKRRYVWAAVSGLALGWIITTRPLTAVAVSAPVILHALSRLLDTMWEPKLRGKFVATFAPLLMLSAFVAPTAGLWPLFNHIWTGDWRTNTYQMLWPYDSIGFGPDHGVMKGAGCESQYGCHTLEYGWRNARTDLVVYMRDLFGWTLSPPVANYLAVHVLGLTPNSDAASVLGDSVVWGMLAGLSWLPVVAGLIAGRKREWVWLFFEMFIAIVIAQLTYWIGSTVHGGAAYSLRYYYEATFALCIVGGFGIVAWANALKGKHGEESAGSYSALRTPDVGGTAPAARSIIAIDYLNGVLSGRAQRPALMQTFTERLKLAWDRLWPGYILFLIACAASLVWYTPARFQENLPGWPNGLFRYNKVGQHQIAQINEMRAKWGSPNQPVLILVIRNPDSSIEDNWRDYGAAMALSSPFLDSDILVARIFEKEDAPDLIRRFPNRLVLYQISEKLYLSIDDVAAQPDVDIGQ